LLRPFRAHNGLNYVTCVSWPRSGHHLLERVLSAYFGDRWGYCEYYNCCNTYPCANSETVFCKNHDFGHDLSVPDGAPLVVQYREFLPSILSDFDLQVHKGRTDAVDQFYMYALERLPDYVRFKLRWGGSRAGCVILPYEELTASPQEALRRVIELFGVAAVDDARLAEVVATVTGHKITGAGEPVFTPGHGVRATRDIEGHRFFSPEGFGMLASAAAQNELVTQAQLDDIWARAPCPH
jgi:hypothetical protein